MNVEKIGKVLFGFSYALSFIILIIIAFLNVFLTMCYTGSFTVRNPYFDMTAAIIGVIIAIAIMYALNRMTGFISRMKLKHVIMISIAFTVIIAFTWLTLSGFRDRGDGENMMKIGFDIIRNDYHDENYIYLQRYPYQSGVLIIMLPFVMLFQNMKLDGVYLMMSYANIVLMIITMLNLVFIAKRLNGEKTAKWTALILMMFIPLPLSMIEVYGNIMSLPLITGMILLAISINDNKAFKPFMMRILSILILAIIAGFIKPNNMIIGIALTISFILYACIHHIQLKKTIIMIIAGILIIPCMMAGKTIAVNSMEMISGIKFEQSEAQPMRNFIAMGLNDGSDHGKGFYYQEAGYAWTDAKTINRNANEILSRQINKLTTNPLYAINFFSVKIAQTWAEPTFSYQVRVGNSIFLNVVKNKELQGKMQLTAGEKIVTSSAFMVSTRTIADAACIIISIMALIGLPIAKRKHDIMAALPALCILGGFIFHVFWETQPEYAYTYFLLLIPYAGIGLEVFTDACNAVRKKREPAEGKDIIDA